jgi:hypothetical protein
MAKRMRTKFAVYIVALVMAVNACPAARGARQANSRLKGAVVDWNYARVLGTSIVFESGPFKKTVEVNEEGEYDVELPAGDYLIKVASAGFRQRRVRFRLEPGVTESLSFMLDVIPTKPVKCPRGSICL